LSEQQIGEIHKRQSKQQNRKEDVKHAPLQNQWIESFFTGGVKHAVLSWLEKTLSSEGELRALWRVPFLQGPNRESGNVVYEWLHNNLRQELRGSFDGLVWQDWMVLAGLLRGTLIRIADETYHSKSEAAKDEHWPTPTLLATLMHDTQQNGSTLQKIREDLSVLGVPLRAWLIEHRERLYNCFGYETYEPVFDQMFLDRIAVGMWDLSLRIFGSGRFSYDELASEVREPAVNIVRRGVRRLAIVTRGMCDGKWEKVGPSGAGEFDRICQLSNNKSTSEDPPDPIWAGEHFWKWNRRMDTKRREPILSDVRKRIADLQSPTPQVTW